MKVYLHICLSTFYLLKRLLNDIVFPKKSLGKISLTSNLWTDPELRPFMAITAHWIEDINGTLRLRADLITFHHTPGNHTGANTLKVFHEMVERAGITRNVIISRFYIPFFNLLWLAR